MPNARSPNQKLVTCWMDAALVQTLEQGRKKARVARSQFVRDAIIEKLQQLGFEIHTDVGLPPDRTNPVEPIRVTLRNRVKARLEKETKVHAPIRETSR